MRPTAHIPDFRIVSRTAHGLARRAVDTEVATFADDQLRGFKTRIQAQAFVSFKVVHYPESGTNLSPRWLATKAAAGADPRTLIATGHYWRSLRVFRHKGVAETTFRIDFPPNAHARDLHGRTAAITLSDLARVLEFGTRDGRIPPRPHWRPHKLVLHVAARSARVRCNRAIGRKLRTVIGPYMVRRVA